MFILPSSVYSVIGGHGKARRSQILSRRLAQSVVGGPGDERAAEQYGHQAGKYEKVQHPKCSMNKYLRDK